MLALVVALGFNAVLLVALWLLWRDGQRASRVAERREQAHQAERQHLLDRIMYLSGQAWNPPPVYEPDLSERSLLDDEEPYFPTDNALTIV